MYAFEQAHMYSFEQAHMYAKNGHFLLTKKPIFGAAHDAHSFFLCEQALMYAKNAHFSLTKKPHSFYVNKLIFGAYAKNAHFRLEKLIFWRMMLRFSWTPPVSPDLSLSYSPNFLIRPRLLTPIASIPWQECTFIRKHYNAPAIRKHTRMQAGQRNK